MIPRSKLTKENPYSEEIEFAGKANIQIVGTGEVKILRSVGNLPFMPITNGLGSSTVYDNDDEDCAIYNWVIENNSRHVKFKIFGMPTSDAIEYAIYWS